MRITSPVTMRRSCHLVAIRARCHETTREDDGLQDVEVIHPSRQPSNSLGTLLVGRQARVDFKDFNSAPALADETKIMQIHHIK